MNFALHPKDSTRKRTAPRRQQDMDWDKLRIFHAVASAGSFTHAGQMLTLSQSAVSRQISALEEEITTPLFQRHARGLTLTDEGEMLYAAVSDVLTRLVQAEEALKNVRESQHFAFVRERWSAR